MILLPALRGTFEAHEQGLVLSDGENQFVVAVDAGVTQPQLLRTFQSLDGTRSADAVAKVADVNESFVRSLVGALAEVGLVSDASGPEVVPAVRVLFDLEDLANELLYRSIYRNPFWAAMLNSPESTPVNVFVGMAIENYHFLFREAYFDAPALSFPESTRARVLMNDFYREEFGHDELILKGLNALGITRDDMRDSVPLPTTMALCNALSFWARYDPVFFFSTLGVLEGKDVRVDSYVGACERKGMPEAFIAPIRAHAKLNMDGDHGSLTRAMFEHLPALDAATVSRFRRQTRLFVQLYDGFYTGVWEFYSRCDTPLRTLSGFGAA